MILLTGGAGFIGSNILHALNQQGVNDILVADNLRNASKHLNLNNARFYDYLDKTELLNQLSRLPAIELVIHQGACSATTETDGRYMMENNYAYSKTLLHFCIERKIPFIYASSAATYGDGKKGFNDRHDNYFPLNVYGYSKLLFDRYVRRMMEQKELHIPVTGLRYFNVYGYQENHKGDMASVIYKMFRQVEEGKPITLFEGSDEIFRDFIFIEDVVNVVLFFMNQQSQGIYNCGTGLERSFGDIARNFMQ
ncbi:MAG: ADP-glyceromanno-heptose 6-epimerase, partial [Dinghuibacter sp.]|nr:ADP-glyceromanno-heptose 6-epimerase [Dinghuibacter sp.]